MAVLNHIGGLKDIPITGNRIFTYGMLRDCEIIIIVIIEMFNYYTNIINVFLNLNVVIRL